VAGNAFRETTGTRISHASFNEDKPMRKPSFIVLVLACGGLTWGLTRLDRPTSEQLLILGLQTDQRGWVDDALAAGASPNAQDRFGVTALMWAARNGDEPAVRRLLLAGADHSARCPIGVTPLSCAASNGHARVLNQLLDAGSEVDQPVTDGRTALHAATQMAQLDAVRTLIDRGADVNARDAQGQTPLITACWRGSYAAPMIQLLIDSGADLDARDNRDQTALTCAVADGTNDVADLLRTAASRRATTAQARQAHRPPAEHLLVPAAVGATVPDGSRR
jgi:ankyrin repeat protein